MDTIWVCAACGRTADKKENMKDPSCAIWAVECYTAKGDDGSWVAVNRDERGE